MSAVHPANLRVEHAIEPLAVDEPQPRFSWTLSSSRRGASQSAYRLLVSTSRHEVAEAVGNHWDSGERESSDQLLIAYDGPALAPDTDYWWTVEVRSDLGEITRASPQRFRTGLMGAAWTGHWIQAPASVVAPSEIGLEIAAHGNRRPSLMRRDFTSRGKVTRATLYATALGTYLLWLNGKRVGDELLAPGWVDFRQRIPYQAYDVTPMVLEGPNTVGALLGDGWYSGRIAWVGPVYGEIPQLLAQLNLQYEDGTSEIVGTDASWEWAPSWLLWSDQLTGEAQRLADRPSGWAEPGFHGGWAPCVLAAAPAGQVEARRGVPVRVLAELDAVSVDQRGATRWVADLGQNLVGVARVRLVGKAGTTITIRHAEMLQPDGELYTANYRTAECIDAFVLDTDDETTVQPLLSWRGFRYVEIDGALGEPSVVGVVIGSDTPTTGSFACSSEMITQLQKNIEWGQRGNFLDVPTDCPQRDERLGWLGDAQVFVGTACWNADVARFFGKWLTDVRDAQSPEGAFPDVAPLVAPESFGRGSAGWGDAGVIVPWVLYQRYGDRRLLEQSWPSIVAWLDYLEKANPDGLWENNRGMDYGDWLAIAEDTPRDVLATSFFAHDATLASRIAEVLGHMAEAERFAKLADYVRGAYRHAYVTPAGRIAGHTQTAYALALAFDLLPQDMRPSAAQHLVDLIERERGIRNAFTAGHAATGFLGVGHLLPVLAAHGHDALAYRLLLNETFPSWGYSIAQGATTIWERWDGWTVERGFQDVTMNSFNHYSLGSVGDWLFQVVGGLRPDDAHPGFGHVVVAPRPGGDISWAHTTHESPRGRIEARWRDDPDAFELEVLVPPGITATVELPGAGRAYESGQPVESAEGVLAVQTSPQGLSVHIASGSYTFQLRRSRQDS